MWMGRGVALAGVVLALAACGGRSDEAAPPQTPPAVPPATAAPAHASVTLQLGSPAGARAAGYLAAEEQGYFEDDDLDVAIRPGRAGEALRAVGSGAAELGVATLPALLAARADGAELVNVAQVFRGRGDGLVARADWIADERNRDVVTRFLRASFRGWIFCRDLPDDCARIAGTGRAAIERTNALLWPNELGIGVIDATDAPPAAFRGDLAEAAIVGITDDVYAAGWEAGR
jgi:ABC-type nitrate/sulfonate/bicarbonate transport system substrate-binding protein